MKWNNKGHQFDKLGNLFKKKDKIYIYSAGIGAIEYYNTHILKFDKNFDLNVYFIDKNENKQKQLVCGKKVLSPKHIFDKYDDSCLIIVGFSIPETTNMVVDRLQRAGYIKNVDFFVKDEFSLNLNDIHLPVYMLYAKNKLVVSSSCYIPSNVCNLRCTHCLNFTNHIKKFYSLDIENVYKDLDLQFKWVDYFGRYQISGGEPMLYKDFVKIVSYIGENYRDKIDIFETVINGTIVPSDDKLEAMKKYDMTVYLDDYRKNLPSGMDKREEIIQKFESYGINWVDNYVDSWFDLDIFATDNSNMSDSELSEYFDFCNNPWHCYKDGKFYLCNFAQFAVDAGISQEDDTFYFDLNDMTEEKKPELLEFLLNYSDKGYAELCKRCAGWAHFNKKRVDVAIQG